MTADWIALRMACFKSAEAWLKARCILVSVIDRQAPVRTYRVTGKRFPHTAGEVIELARDMGWKEEDHVDRAA